MEDTIDSNQAAEILRVTTSNLRQLVFRKELVPVGRKNRRSLFNLADVKRLDASRLAQARQQSTPSA